MSSIGPQETQDLLSARERLEDEHQAVGKLSGETIRPILGVGNRGCILRLGGFRRTGLKRAGLRFEGRGGPLHGIVNKRHGPCGNQDLIYPDGLPPCKRRGERVLATREHDGGA